MKHAAANLSLTLGSVDAASAAKQGPRKVVQRHRTRSLKVAKLLELSRFPVKLLE